jgi:putative endonuclease
MKQGWVYMLANRYRGTIYTGVTFNLPQRMGQHREGQGSQFTSEHEVHRLVYAENCGDIGTAIQREKAVKKWRRDWKINLIERDNPEWSDLYDLLNA